MVNLQFPLVETLWKTLLEVQPEPAQRGAAAGCVSALGEEGRVGTCESDLKAGVARSCRGGGSSHDPHSLWGPCGLLNPPPVCLGTNLMLMCGMAGCRPFPPCSGQVPGVPMCRTEIPL